MRPNGTFKIVISLQENSPFLPPSRMSKAQLVSFDVEATVGDAVQALTLKQKLPKSHLQRAAKNGRTRRVPVLFASSWVT